MCRDGGYPEYIYSPPRVEGVGRYVLHDYMSTAELRYLIRMDTVTGESWSFESGEWCRIDDRANPS